MPDAMVSLAEVVERLRLLEDKEAVAALMNRYFRAADAKDWQAWSRCWAEDGTLDFGPFGTHHGRDAIRDVCSRAEAPYAAMQHSITNLQVEVDGDRAHATAYLWFAGVTDPDRRSLHFDCGGPYDLGFTRTGQGWQVQSVRLDVTWFSGRAPDVDLTVTTTGEATT